MKKRFLSLVVISALMLTMTGCNSETQTTENEITTTTTATESDNAQTTTTTTAEETTEQETTTTEAIEEPSAPTNAPDDNKYNSTAPTNLSEDAEFSIAVEYQNEYDINTYNNYGYKKYNHSNTNKNAEIITINKNTTLKSLSDELATFGGLVEADNCEPLSLNTIPKESNSNDYEFSYIGFGYNLGISDDEYVDLYIEFVDDNGNVIEDKSFVTNETLIKAIAVHEKDITEITSRTPDEFGGNDYPIWRTPLKVKFNINNEGKLYETYLGSFAEYFSAYSLGELIYISKNGYSNEKCYVTKNSKYSVITLPDETYSDIMGTAVFVIN